MSTHSENVRQLYALRDKIIAGAVAARKIAPERSEDYRRMFDAAPVEVTQLLSAPVAAGGLMAGMNLGGEAFPTADNDYPREWLDAADGGHGSVMYEDDAAKIEAIAATAATPPQGQTGRSADPFAVKSAPPPLGGHGGGGVDFEP